MDTNYFLQEAGWENLIVQVSDPGKITYREFVLFVFSSSNFFIKAKIIVGIKFWGLLEFLVKTLRYALQRTPAFWIYINQMNSYKLIGQKVLKFIIIYSIVPVGVYLLQQLIQIDDHLKFFQHDFLHLLNVYLSRTVGVSP